MHTVPMTVGPFLFTKNNTEIKQYITDTVLKQTKSGLEYVAEGTESYDGSKPYVLYFTLPGYGGLYFQGVAANLRSEEFGFEAQKYNNSEMIVVDPQLNDWGETSANQTSWGGYLKNKKRGYFGTGFLVVVRIQR